MCPFCSGVFFQIKSCRMPRDFMDSLNSLELYCELLSVLILSFAASGFSILELTSIVAKKQRSVRIFLL